MRCSKSPSLTASKARFSSISGPATPLVVKIASPMAANASTGIRVARKNQTSPYDDYGTRSPAIIPTVMIGAASTTKTTQTAENENTAGRVCLNQLPRIFLLIFVSCQLVSETSPALFVWSRLGVKRSSSAKHLRDGNPNAPKDQDQAHPGEH